MAIKNPVSLVSLKKEHGAIRLDALLTLILNDLIDFFSVGKTMDDIRVAQTIRLIQEEYYYLTIEDFKVCFDNAKKGHYGKLYDRIDGQVILEWLEQYNVERSAAFVEKNETEAFSQKDRYVRRGDTQQVCDRELHQILGKIKPQQL